jgi:hypothetical protein
MDLAKLRTWRANAAHPVSHELCRMTAWSKHNADDNFERNGTERCLLL